ncbi:MAG TPA: RagB/SusD family nutrient uptake outer membrane protein [Bacteroidales bacterium]|nr:RagB/SusD family nutrient uptake outer membrane protein [Bacteroidales bacterium]
MKKLLIIIISTVALGLYSCDDDFLNVDPVSTLTYGSYWVSEEAARVALTGIHATIRARDLAFFQIGDVRSDIYGGPGFESPNDEIYIMHEIRIDNAVQENWGGFYTDLHRINEAIKYIPTINFTNENEKQYLLGQLHGLRAYYYYIMLMTWGAVPLVTEPTESINFKELAKPRTPEQEIMAQIKSDLTASLNAFGTQNQFQSRQKWSKAASLVLKGDVYLWSGTHLGGGTGDYQQAKAALQEVVGMSGLALLSNYKSVFAYSSKGNNEIIYAFHHEKDQRTSGFHSAMTGRMTELMNMYTEDGNLLGTSLALAGGSRYRPSEDNLSVLFEDHPLDQRPAATWIRLYRDQARTQYGGAITGKFLGTLISGVRYHIDDQPVYRYAYAILLLAEAKNLLGEDPSEQINLIRKRAFGANYDPNLHAYTNSTKHENTEAILREHLKEFQQESNRWWTLRRAGNSYVIDHIQYLSPGEEYKFLLPITRDMIGRNPALIQTPGYGN